MTDGAESPVRADAPPRRRLLTSRRRWMLRGGQWMLVLALIGSIGATIVGSFMGVASYEDRKLALFSEEGDGTAMTFVQRESFGLILKLDEWARGEATRRDVLTARALLGQRLQVRTAGGSTTYELTHGSYREALAELDAGLQRLDADAVADRMRQRDELQPDIERFHAETVELSQAFQSITRAASAASLQQTATSERVQGVFAVVALVLGLTLALWLGADLRRDYRVASARLAEESGRLDRARRRLALHHDLDDVSARWQALIMGDEPVSSLVAEVTREASAMVGGEVTVEGAEQFSPEEVRVRAVTDDPLLEPSDIEAVRGRVESLVRFAVDRERAERESADRQRVDALTGLPNRLALIDALAAARAHADDERLVALTLIDIDRFGAFNSSFGHEEGDRLLVEVGRRLSLLASPADVVLRLSADQFAIVGPRTSGQVDELTERLHVQLPFDWRVGDRDTPVSFTSGVAAEPASTEPAVVLRRASAAFESAGPVRPRPSVIVFEESRHGGALSTLQDESALRDALNTGEFVVQYQPIVAVGDGRLLGAEALVRWNRPDRGLLLPGEFLPLLYSAGLLPELGSQVLDLGCGDWTRERAESAGTLDEAYLSLNVDVEQLAAGTFPGLLSATARRWGMPLDRLVIEVTERALLSDPEQVGQLEELRGRGVRVAIDDFGTGYSSLGRLGSLPVDILKVDRSFVQGAVLGSSGAGLLRDVAAMGASLGLVVTAEGVETEEDLELLRAAGIDAAQGWHIAHPMPMGQLREWLAARRPARRPSRGRRP